MLTKCTACGAQMVVMPPAGGGEIGGPPAVRERDSTKDKSPPKVKARPPSKIIDLPAPKGPSPREIVDLPAPKRPTGPLSDLRPPEIPDLPTPVGPVPTRGITDLPTPVGPVPTRGITDLPTPVGPVPTRGITDLLTPVGPVPTRGIDLPTPVGSLPSNVDYPLPVGPVPTKGIDLPAPVGPIPTRGVDLPAPKGFFDEAPPPASGNRPRPPELSLDDLDVVPVGEAPSVRQAPIEFPAPPTDAQFSMDSLTLEQPTELPLEQASFGNVDLPESPTEELPGVVSFGKPASPPLMAESLDLAEPARRRKIGTVLDADERGARPAVSARGKRTLILILVLLAALGAGAFYIYQNVELEVFGLMTAPAQGRQRKIDAGQKSARKLLAADDWYQAATVAERAAALDEKGSELYGLGAQAYLAAAIDVGLAQKQDRGKAEKLLQTASARPAPGPEVAKAQALRMVVDGKPADARKALDGIAAGDPNLPLYRGWASLEAKDPAAAATAFAAALQAVPGRVPALYGLGMSQLAAGQKDEARKTFHQLFDKGQHYGAWLALTELERPAGSPEREKELAVLCEKAPEREKANPRDVSRAWTLYAREAMAVGRWDQAAERFRKAREISDQSFDAAIGDALVAVEIRTAGGAVDLGQARQILAKAVELDPKAVDAQIGLARVSMLEGKLEEAKIAIAGATKMDETNAKARYWQGRILDGLDEVAPADAAYQKAIELAPRDYTAHVALAALLTNQARAADRGGKKDKAKELNERAVTVLTPVADAAKSDPKLALTLGNAYLGARNAATAETWFRRAVALDGENVDARLSLAQSLEGQGKLPDAVAEYERAREKAPRREDIALGLAGAYQKGKNRALADALYTKLLAGEGGTAPTPRVRAAAARYYVRTGRLDQALAQGPLIAAGDAANPTVVFLRGLEALRDGKRDEALKLLKEAVAAAPEPEIWDALGRVLEMQPSLQEAQAAYQEASRIDPTYAAPFIGLGRIALARRTFGAALRELDKAVVLAPESAEVFAMLGQAHFELGAYQKAIGAYKDSLARGDSPETTYRLGLAYYRIDAPQTADTLRRAIDRAPAGATWLPEALRALGQRYRADNRRAEMCATFARYLQIAPSTELLRDEVKRMYAGCQ